MRTILPILAAIVLPAATLAQQPPPNTLSPAETAAGWKLLFDGTSSEGWRAYRGESFPASGWAIENGCIKSSAGTAADIVTTDQYGDFELQLEWKASPKGNSGIIYRLSERHDASWQTGPEFQILDDAGYGANPTDMHAAGACYELAAPAANKVLHPAGEFNHARIVLHNGQLQHFLNGVKVAECRMDDDSWKERIAKSKFKEYEGFGLQPTGRIGIQHHGNDMWFRNIKIRDLSKPMPDEKALFNGKNLEGWAAFFPEERNGAKMEDVWSVIPASDPAESVLVCKGNPIGYLHTIDSYDNYVLKLEWRYPKDAGNSGVLLRQIGEHKIWPRSIEAQLQSGNAGDFWNIDKFQMTAAPDRTSGRNTKRTHGSERPLNEWNAYEIIVDGGTVTLNVNNETVNQATNCEAIPGKIALQSEGTEIHFRNIRLAPIGK